MNSFKITFGKDYVKVKLSLLWLFVMLNYIYADILSLMDASVLNELIAGAAGELQITSTFLFFGAILMEIPIAMIIFSLILERKVSRPINIIAGSIKTLAVLGTMFVGVPALYYSFFGVIEIATTISIIYIAWNWSEEKN